MIPAGYSEKNLVVSKNTTHKGSSNKTYYMDIKNNRIFGYVNGLEAVKQAVYKILETERYDYLIYDWDYGIEKRNLIGKDVEFVKNDVQRVIKEALKADDRISDVQNFTFSNQNDNELNVFFTVISDEGDFESEVSINV